MGNSTVEYRDVPGFPGYRVGSDGSVWSRKKKGNWVSKVEDEWKPMRVGKHKRGEYLLVTLIHERRSKTFLLHRLVLLAFVGPPPPGKPLGLHEDDDKSNNTPGNLRWGTHLENMKDAMRNGKVTRGMVNGCAKLTEEQVKEIIRLRAEEGIGSRRIARRFGVVYQTIQRILSGVNWSYLDRQEYAKGLKTQADTIRGGRNPSVKLTEGQVKEIVRLRRKNKWSQQYIADKMGVHQTLVSAILHGHTWSHVTGITEPSP